MTTFVTKYFIDFPASVGRQPAEEVAGVPLFTALGYPEPQIRFHFRRPPSLETAVAFFSTFDLEKLKTLVGTHAVRRTLNSRWRCRAAPTSTACSADRAKRRR